MDTSFSVVLERTARVGRWTNSVGFDLDERARVVIGQMPTAGREAAQRCHRVPPRRRTDRRADRDPARQCRRRQTRFLARGDADPDPPRTARGRHPAVVVRASQRRAATN